ncbi:rhomboid family intramembrane serine protease GlpG [Salmonella enterica subsp. enterica serovar Virchow]|nr:rhomboid family intramembrane serine protease GlpG [Salmonella enterica subsp. enterica serovar Virchow]ECF2319066.1 rhomboid family intramembrane serine protease GlpG [Salmonella enterica subsp. enterica serovar Virchow]
MEDVKLYVERVGVDPASGADIRIARRESTSWHKDIVAELINQVLRCGATLIIIAVLTACDDRQVSYFPDYAAIPEQSGQTNSGLRYRRFPFLATLRERAGPVTWIVMLACVLVYIAMSLIGDQTVMVWLAWPFDPVLKFEVWRYFTHIFMHFSLMHILFNLLWWWYLGGAVEKRLGSGKLIVITVISALLSGYVQQKFSGPWFGGLSGVVYALMGYVWLRGERDPQSGIYLQRGLIIFALLWIVAGWFDWFGMSMANGAHIAGLIVGLAMAFVDTLNARKRT